ncbi:hypothetical protein BLOT_009409 [Blomia tropicalis]|nr:hypothetical protein BLOT_009409 [Blomia tropicalis]
MKKVKAVTRNIFYEIIGCTTIGHTLDHGDDGGETMQTNVRVKRCFGTIFGGTSGGLTGSTGTGINGQPISGVQQLRSPRMFKQSLQNLFGIFGPSTFSNRLFPTFSNYGSSFGRLIKANNNSNDRDIFIMLIIMEHNIMNKKEENDQKVKCTLVNIVRIGRMIVKSDYQLDSKSNSSFL